MAACKPKPREPVQGLACVRETDRRLAPSDESDFAIKSEHSLEALEVRHLAQHVCATACLEDFKAQESDGRIKSRVARHNPFVGGVKFIDEVAKLASGKIRRNVMRDWAKRDAREMEGTIKVRS